MPDKEPDTMDKVPDTIGAAAPGDGGHAGSPRRKHKKPRIVESAEYVFARLGVWLVEHVPPRAACWMAKSIGSLAYLLMRKRRKTAIGNILRAKVAKTPKEARRIARASMQSIALTVAESFIYPRLADQAAHLVMEVPDSARKAIEESKCGFICFSGHFGNWEVGARAMSSLRPVTGIARPMNNRRVQELMDRKKMRADFETIDKHTERPMDIVRALKRNRALAILSDQHARGDSAAVVDFFGRPAKTYTTPVVMQQLTGAPIFFSYALRVGFMRFRVVFSEPLYYKVSRQNKAADIQAATQDLSKKLEDVIRQHPEQYLWAHRRWKYAERLEAQSPV